MTCKFQFSICLSVLKHLSFSQQVTQLKTVLISEHFPQRIMGMYKHNDDEPNCASISHALQNIYVSSTLMDDDENSKDVKRLHDTVEQVEDHPPANTSQIESVLVELLLRSHDDIKLRRQAHRGVNPRQVTPRHHTRPTLSSHAKAPYATYVCRANATSSAPTTAKHEGGSSEVQTSSMPKIKDCEEIFKRGILPYTKTNVDQICGIPAAQKQKCKTEKFRLVIDFDSDAFSLIL